MISIFARWWHSDHYFAAFDAHSVTHTHQRPGRLIPIHGRAKSEWQSHFLSIFLSAYAVIGVALPPSISTANTPKWTSYAPMHGYTIVQIVVTLIIFVITLTRAAPAFPSVIIALVPVRLLLMNKIWRREVLRFVDAWACREGTPEDDEERRARTDRKEGPGIWRLDGQDVIEMAFLGRDTIETGSTRRKEDNEDVQEQAQ